MPKEHIVRRKLTSCECRMCCDSIYVGNEENDEFEIMKGVCTTPTATDTRIYK